MAAGETIHASAVLVEGRGVLLRGPSGSGKSSLALALLLADRERNRLIADDRVALRFPSNFRKSPALFPPVTNMISVIPAFTSVWIG